jgi:hypothetical protein
MPGGRVCTWRRSDFADRRRGVALALVLIAAVVAFVISSAYLTSQSTAITISQNVQDQAQARYVAESGLRIAAAYVQSSSSWRNDQVHGTWVTDAPYGPGTFSVVGEDGADVDGDGTISQPAEGDGDLANRYPDLLTLTVTGKVNGAAHVVRAVITPGTSYAGELLLVVDNAGNLSDQELLRKTWIEEWGYAVEPITASAAQGTFDSAAVATQVAYIAANVSAGDLGTKLRDVAIGVVNEGTDLASELDFSNDGSTYTGAAIDITDNGHYLTSPYSLGALSILSSPSELDLLGSSLAPGANALAVRPSTSDTSLIVINKGAMLSSGGTAAGRRVDLPWGGGAFDVDTLNDDGKVLMRRAIMWAAGLYDFTSRTPGVNAFAYQGEDILKVPTTATTPSTEFSAGAYAAIAADDASSHSYTVPTNNLYAQMRFVLPYAGSAASVSRLKFKLIGRNVNTSPGQIDGVELHVWNYSASTYELVAVSDDTEAEVTLTGALTLNLTEYLGGAALDTVTLLAVSRSKRTGIPKQNTLEVDYVSMEVTAEATGVFSVRWVR